MKKKLILLCPLFWSIFSSCHHKSATDDTYRNESILVIAEKVTGSSIADVLYLSGNIEGYRTVKLGFMVPGKIDYAPVEEGQYVTEGQLIASLDPTNYQITKNMADVQVDEALDQYNRLRFMYERNSISESDFKKMEFALQQAKNEQELSAKSIRDTRLLAPFSGYLIKKLADKGEIVAMGLPLFIVSDIHKVKVEIAVPETELSKVTFGEYARVSVSATDSVYTGRITEVGALADPESRTFTAKVELDNPGMLLRPGMIAEVNIETGDRRDAISLPLGALLKHTDGGNYVYVVDSDKKRAFIRRVVTGSIMHNRIEIISGLREGDTVVTGGNQKLYDGAPVTISN